MHPPSVHETPWIACGRTCGVNPPYPEQKEPER